MGVVTVEVLSWLRAKLGYPEGSPGEGAGKVVVAVEVVEGESLGTLFAWMAVASPQFAEHVYDAADARIREGVVVILNGRAVELAGGPAAPLRAGDRLVLLPGFAGG